MDVADAAAIDEVKAAIRAHEAAVEAADVESIVCGGTDDAVVLIPNAPLFVGKDAVRALYAQQLAMGKWTNLHHQYLGECVVGDVAVLHGVATSTFTPPGAPPMTFANNFILTYRRGADGRWLVWRVAFAPTSA
jgi:ketosteroid isomerase-like protein